MDDNDIKLAIFGGVPYRTKNFANWPELDNSDIEGVLEVVKSGVWSRAVYTNHLKYQYETESHVGEFEKIFTEYLKMKHGVFVNSGTSALHLAFETLELPEGSEVITTPYTFFSTAAPLYRNNLKPVFVDIDGNGNIDSNKIEEKITDQTKAVLIMHCAGYPCNMEKIQNICIENELYLVEDCAHAVFSEYKNRHVASYGDISIFSFEASKNLNCGEGGFITTNDDALFNKMYSIQSCGRPINGEWRNHINMCENYRPSEFQGVLAKTQFMKMEAQQKRRIRSMNYLNEAFKKHPLVEPIFLKDGATSHGSYAYILKVKPEYRKKLSGKRFAIYCEMEGIPCNSGYLKLIPDIVYAMNFSTEEERERIKEDCPTAYEFLKYCIWLPQTILISDMEDVKDVVRVVDKIYANVKK